MTAFHCNHTHLGTNLPDLASAISPTIPWIKTSAGTVQLGCPPETAKIWMRKGEAVPTVYILPDPFFRGRVNYGDIEFPIYWYSYVNKWLEQSKQITLVGSDDQIRRINIILSETILGPARSTLEASGHPANEIDRIDKESLYFAAKNKQGTVFGIESFVKFVPFNSEGCAAIDPNVSIFKKGNDHFLIKDQNSETELTFPDQFPGISIDPFLIPESFIPPFYGITCIGTSSGFDAHGLTTSFILWRNHKGIIIDPLAYVNTHLKALRIEHTSVNDILLTHVHGDHDPGLIEFILEGKKRLYTSRIIYESFLRKAEAITGKSFKNKVEFIELESGVEKIIGEDFRITTRNNFHSIPTIGFRIDSIYGSFAYSGDTFYKPAKLKELVEAGVLNEERLKEIQIPNADFGFHEAGIPPIHTPVADIVEVSEQRNHQKIFLVHRGQPKEGEENLNIAKSGENIIFKQNKD